MGMEAPARPSPRALFGSLRVKLAVGTLVLLLLGTFTAAWYMRDRFANRYDKQVHAQLQSIGNTLALDLSSADLEQPDALTARLGRVRLANPELITVGVSRHVGASWIPIAASRLRPSTTMSRRRRTRTSIASSTGTTAAIAISTSRCT